MVAILNNTSHNARFQSFSSARTSWLGILCVSWFVMGWSVCNWGGWAGVRSNFFSEKGRGPPTSLNGLMHHHSQTTAQKHLTLPHPDSTQKNRK